MTDQPSAAPPPPAGWHADQNDPSQERWWDGSKWSEATRPSAAAQPPPKKKRRVFVWVFLAIQVLFLIWVIAGASSGSGQPDDCGSLSAQTCNDASDTGTAIGVFLIIVFWAFVDIILGVTYGVWRLARRR